MISTHWFLPQRRAAFTRMNLFCFHHAGGAASYFKDWGKAMSPAVNVIAVQMPGREGRFSEAFASCLEDMVDSLVACRSAFEAVPYAFFGHSLGARFAYEAARGFMEADLPPPLFLVASGHRSPDLGPPDELLHVLPDDAFISRMSEKYGGIAPEVLDTPELLQLLLPRFRADMRLSEGVRYKARAPAPFPIAVLHGLKDRSVRSSELAGWQRETTRQVVVHEFDGDHFFPDTNLIAVQSIVNKLLAAQLWRMGV